MRKNFILLAIFSILAFTTNAQSKAVKANPLGLLFGIGNAGFEFTTTDSQSLSFSGLYFNVLDITGAGAGAEYRFYFDGEAITGWHAGPTLGFFSLSDDFDTSATLFSIGGEVGHQWVFGEHFLLDVFATLGTSVGGDELSGLDFSSAGFGVSIGYAW